MRLIYLESILGWYDPAWFQVSSKAYERVFGKDDPQESSYWSLEFARPYILLELSRVMYG